MDYNIVYAAFCGEYGEPYLMGIFNTLEKAKQKIVKSKPEYDTEVKEYDTTLGVCIQTHFYWVKNKKWTI